MSRANTPNANDEPQKDCAAVEISHLKKQYAGATSPSVNDLSLTCRAGEIVGILGHNGAGKSTVLKCITGILPFEEGEIKINGYDIKTSPVKAKHTFGYVSDRHDVFVKMTGAQYVNFMADAYGVDKKTRKKRLSELEEVFNLKDRLLEPIGSYSHGMRQKICMAGSLIHHPKLWILDEPMIGLDPVTSAKVADFMKAYAKEGNCILFSSHNTTTIKRICDRAIIISDGVKTDDFVLSEWNNDMDLEEYFIRRTDAQSANKDSK